MKKFFTLTTAILLLVTTGFTQTQNTECPTIFDIKRNNGGNMPQGQGTCGGDAQIRLYVRSCPTNAPRLDSIYYEGKKITGITFGAADVANCDKPNSYLSYCVFGNNIPPAKKLTFFFTYVFPNGTTNTVCDVPEGGPTPVNVSSFLVGRTGNAVSLTWKTEIELNAVNFEVQRSYDNSSFKTIGTVAGTINGASTTSYSFVDNSNTSKTLSFYRLRIVKQGEITYSDIKTVKGLASNSEFVIYPNPSIGHAKVTISDISEPTRVQLLDNSGRLVKTLMLNNTNTVELNGLSKGSYIVRIIGSVSGNSEVRKLTVIN